MFIVDSLEEITIETIEDFINKHRSTIKDYIKNHNMYIGKHDILSQAQKEQFKPDNRLVINFAKYIVDTFNGFFIGNPIKISHDNEKVDDYLNFINRYNNQDDNNAELSKMCSIYGNAYELLYVDEEANVCITYLPPTEAFLIYDNSINQNVLCGVRYYYNSDNELEGTYSDSKKIYYFKEGRTGLEIYEEKEHYFREVPFVEYVENEEKQGAFDNVKTLINAYNKAMSEKANDVDYYADAYLLILGAELDNDTLQKLRDSRIINMSAQDIDKLKVEFLSKPNSDETQENLINRLEKMIFHISMVSNINDENFGNATGISLKYKLQSMMNLAATKERKFTMGMNKRYRLISNLPNNNLTIDDVIGINYKFTRNIPSNLLEETQIAQGLQGIVSEETQLKVLSIVDNVKDEINRREKEEDQRNDKYVMIQKQNVTEDSNKVDKYD